MIVMITVTMMPMIYIVQFQKISILPPEKVFCFAPPIPPGNSSLASYFASKILTFKTPLPLGISDDIPWGGMTITMTMWMIMTRTIMMMMVVVMLVIVVTSVEMVNHGSGE